MSVGRVAVIGGGITGLAAAFELSRDASAPHVTLFESESRLGGKLQSSPFAGLDAVDEGADAFLARVPWGTQFCADLGITDLVSPATRSAFVWHGERLHPLPEGLVLGVPAGIGGLIRSRLLSPLGIARAGIDVVRPRTAPDHDNLGRLVRDRFGSEVLERLVDPLIGSINAGDADSLSLRASAPQIADVAVRSRSLLLGLRKARPAPSDAPIFYAPRRGMADLAATTAAHLAASPNVDLRAGTPVTELAPDGSGWRVNDEHFDAVVITSPAHAAADLVAAHSGQAADAMRGIPYAGVVMVTAHVSGLTDKNGSGYLVPKPDQGDVTAVSFASRKWAHWQPPGGGSLLRISLGRLGHQAPLDYDDAKVVEVALSEVSRHVGMSLDARATRVGRWPQSFPQYVPHHTERVADIERSLARDCPGLVVAGAAYGGVGVPACIRQARSAARLLLDA